MRHSKHQHHSQVHYPQQHSPHQQHHAHFLFLFSPHPACKKNCRQKEGSGFLSLAVLPLAFMFVLSSISSQSVKLTGAAYGTPAAFNIREMLLFGAIALGLVFMVLALAVLQHHYASKMVVETVPHPKQHTTETLFH